MPYIHKDRRPFYDVEINKLVSKLPGDTNTMVGDFNYIVSQMLRKYIKTHGKKYARYNALMGALDCIGREFYIRDIRPYEDEAIKKNGDL